MKRVIYKNNPIVEAIIQIRFPKILSLNSEDPSKFQDAIREDFPIYKLTIERQQEISLTSPDAPPSIIQKKPIKNHNFISADGFYKINLTSSFISISTVKYSRWEDMIERFKKPLEAFLNLYQPPFVNRIGLRYIDAFSRSKLNLEDSNWDSLIAAPLIGAFSNIEEGKIINSSIDYEYTLDNGVSRAKIHAGLGHLEDNTEILFVIDGDFIHIATTESSEIFNVLEYLHLKEKEFIHSSITQKLHDAMNPEPA